MSMLVKLKALLVSPDSANVEMGIMLMKSLDDCSVTTLLKPFSYVDGILYPPPIFQRHASAYVELLAYFSQYDKQTAVFCSTITKLTIPVLRHDGQLQPFSALRSLSIYRAEPGANLAILSTLNQLEELQLVTIMEGDNLNFVAGLSNLKTLTITNWTSLTDMSALRNHPALTSIRIVACPQLCGADVLMSVPNLQQVQVFGAPKVVVPPQF